MESRIRFNLAESRKLRSRAPALRVCTKPVTLAGVQSVSREHSWSGSKAKATLAGAISSVAASIRKRNEKEGMVVFPWKMPVVFKKESLGIKIISK